MSTNGNGSKKILLSLVTVLALALVGVIGAWGVERSNADRELAAADKDLSNRIAFLERQGAGIDERLKALNEKIDRLLSERGLKQGQ